MLGFLNFLKKEKKKFVVSDNYGNFNLENIKGKFYVESVYDGDTITVLVPTKLSIYNMDSSNTVDLDSNTNKEEKIVLNKIRVRLYGIDTPELRPKKTLPNRDEHIAKAKEARDFLSGLVLNKIIRIEFLSNDKYGRPLVKIYNNNICFNDLITEKGYAKKYDGGTKDNNFDLSDIGV